MVFPVSLCWAFHVTDFSPWSVWWKWRVLIISTGFKVHWCLHQPSCCLVFYFGMSLDQRGYCFRLGTTWVDTWKRPTVPFKSCRARNPLRLGVLHRIRWDKHLSNKQEHSFIHWFFWFSWEYTLLLPPFNSLDSFQWTASNRVIKIGPSSVSSALFNISLSFWRDALVRVNF